MPCYHLSDSYSQLSFAARKVDLDARDCESLIRRYLWTVFEPVVMIGISMAGGVGRFGLSELATWLCFPSNPVSLLYLSLSLIKTTKSRHGMAQNP